MRFLITILLIDCFCYSVAQTGTTLLHPSTGKVVVSKGFFYFDSSCTVDYEQVSSPSFTSRFQAGDLLSIKIPADINCYWLKLTLENTAANNDNWLLEFNQWKIAEVYSVDGRRNIKKQVTGHVVPAAEKDLLLANRNLIRINLGKGQKTELFAKLITGNDYMQRPENLSASLYSPDALFEHQRKILNIIYFFTGIYIVMFLYNLFVLFSTKDKNYGYYLFLIFFAMFSLWENTGYTVELFQGTKNFPSWMTNFDLVSSTLFGIALILFTRNFLHTKKNALLTDKIFNYIIIALILILVPGLLGKAFLATNISALIGMATTFLILIASVRSYRQGHPSAGIFLLANGAFMVSIFVYLALALFQADQNFLFNFSIPIGSAMQIVLFSFALGNKINVLKKANTESQQQLIVQLKQFGELQEKTNRELEQKVEERTKELRDSQQQLLQQEKLASLGELTAGVAHEIQNPLNFIKNFSELTVDLVAELKQELNSGNSTAAEEITENLKTNTEKIGAHANRIDAIVRGMLQHTRGGTSSKEPVELNAMCDEYVGLAFHALRAKDKTFSSKMVKAYDPLAGAVNVNRQNFGRALLNLLNNAFYAVHEKKFDKENGEFPAVTIATKRSGDKVQIFIRDNGDGIKETILNKIFQPFFTTKPTGKGTGLGLSISYEIIKEHLGQLIVNTEEGKFTEFIITLPL